VPWRRRPASGVPGAPKRCTFVTGIDVRGRSRRFPFSRAFRNPALSWIRDRSNSAVAPTICAPGVLTSAWWLFPQRVSWIDFSDQWSKLSAA
jgi:hypothetical protein